MGETASTSSYGPTVSAHDQTRSHGERSAVRREVVVRREELEAMRRREAGGRFGRRPVGPHSGRRRESLRRLTYRRQADIRESRGDRGRLRRANRWRPPVLITTDDCANYKDVLLAQYGELVVPPRSERAGRPPVPFKQWPAGAAYATVNKTYAKGRVAEIRRSLVFGTPLELAAALEGSRTSSTINTSIVERQNDTDRTTTTARRARPMSSPRTCWFTSPSPGGSCSATTSITPTVACDSRCRTEPSSTGHPRWPSGSPVNRCQERTSS